MDPLLFTPYFRPQVWGGRRFERYFGPLPDNDAYGEAWVVSAQPLHVSCVSEGPHQGKSLSELWATERASLIGPDEKASSAFPLLLKFLDCQELLSIQVHPSDTIARQLRLGEQGKSEAWIVLAAEPGARIYAGLHPGVSPATLEACERNGTLTDCLHSFIPIKGDCVFLPAGTVHAVGGGVLLAEIQQSSDVTFRLFDWNRRGPDGQPRPLHVQEALRCIHWPQGPINPIVPRVIVMKASDNHGAHLVACRHFAIDRFQLAAPMRMPHVNRMSVWMVLDGGAELSIASTGYHRYFHAGETVLVPAMAYPLQWLPLPTGVTLLAASMPVQVKRVHTAHPVREPVITVPGLSCLI